MISRRLQPRRQVREDSLPGRKVVLAAIYIGTFSGLVPIAIAAQFNFNAAYPAFETTWALGLVVVAGICLSLNMASAQPRLFQYAFSLYLYCFLCLPGFTQLIAGQFPDTTQNLDPSFVGQALAAITLGILTVGLVAHASRRHTSTLDAPTQGRATNQGASVILGVAGLAVAGFYISRVGPATFFTSRADLDYAKATVFPDPTTAALVASSATVPLLVVLHALAPQIKFANPWRRVGLITFLLIVAGILIFEVNIVTSSRYGFGTVALSLLVLIGAFSKPGYTRITKLAILLTLILFFPIIGAAFRRADSSAAESVSGVQAFIQSGDYDSFAQIVNSVEYVHTAGITWGYQMLGPLFFFVPRTLWPNKPQDTGVLIGQFKGYGFTNLSAPLWAEGMVSGGFVGVVVLFAIGTFVIVRSNLTVHATAMPTVERLLASILSFYSIILLRGSLLQASATVGVILGCAWLVSRGRGRYRLPANDFAPAAKGDAS